MGRPAGHRGQQPDRCRPSRRCRSPGAVFHQEPHIVLHTNWAFLPTDQIKSLRSTKLQGCIRHRQPHQRSCHAGALLLCAGGKQFAPLGGVLPRPVALAAADAEVAPLHKVERQQLHNGLRDCEREGEGKGARWEAWQQGRGRALQGRPWSAAGKAGSPATQPSQPASQTARQPARQPISQLAAQQASCSTRTRKLVTCDEPRLPKLEHRR